MSHLILVSLFFSCLLRPSLSLSSTYLKCQLQKPPGESPLAECPDGTLYVSPTDSRANFSHVQEAISSLPRTGDAVILIGEGEYFEMINVTRSAPLTLLGQLDSATAFLPFGNASQRNLVRIWNNMNAKNGMKDKESATLTVAPPLGRSFGNIDFKAYSINFENRVANYSISPSLVTSVMHANASFYGCTFASFQDTWYTGHGASTYVVESIIRGETDYVFGFGMAWFESSTLANRGCGGGITAWAGTPRTTNGVYVANSRIIRSHDANATTVTSRKCYLGRPWNLYAVSVFLRSYSDESIHPDGFTPWSADTVPNTTFYAEFDSYGPGGNMSTRILQDHILDSTQAQRFRLEEVFGGVPSWIDFEYQYQRPWVLDEQ